MKYHNFGQNYVSTNCVVANGLDKCLDEARDQDSKNTVSKLSQEETVSQDFPSLINREYTMPNELYIGAHKMLFA